MHQILQIEFEKCIFQHFIENEECLFSKMLAKGMHQIAQIEFENCILLVSERELPLISDTPFFNGKKIYKSSGAKASK